MGFRTYPFKIPVDHTLVVDVVQPPGGVSELRNHAIVING